MNKKIKRKYPTEFKVAELNGSIDEYLKGIQTSCKKTEREILNEISEIGLKVFKLDNE